MSEIELVQDTLRRLFDALNKTNACVGSLVASVERLEQANMHTAMAIGRIHARLQLQEAGTAMYEVEHVGRNLN